MYTRHIDIKNDLIFITENLHVVKVIKEFPDDITFYVETENDWWFEREPFEGREKFEELRQIALDLLAQAQKDFISVDHMLQELNEHLKNKQTK